MRTIDQKQVYVWDPFVRLFHWTLVVAFTIAYFTEDDLLKLHVWAGYVVGALIVAWVMWGFIGPARARFSDFISDPATTLRYVRDLVLFRAERHLGHSPGGGAMVVLLLFFLTATVVTGLVVYGGEHQAGPLAGMFSKDTGETVEGAHEVLANITLALVLVDIAAVILASFAHHENLVRAMTTGYKSSRSVNKLDQWARGSRGYHNTSEPVFLKKGRQLCSGF
jgi:cytochrome b